MHEFQKQCGSIRKMSGTQQHKLCTQLHVCRRSSFKSFLATARSTATPHHQPSVATRGSCGPCWAYELSNGVISCNAANIRVPAQAQSRFAASPTSTPSTVVAPIASNPNIHSQSQSTAALATTVNQTGMPCVFGRAHAGTASHRDPSLNKWPSCPDRPADSHLVAPCGAIAAT